MNQPFTQPNERPTLPFSFFADLTREEYVDFELTRAKLIGSLRARILQVASFLVSALGLWVVACLEYFRDGYIDWMVIGLGALFLVIGYHIFNQPARIRRHAERAYDAAIASGRDFQGTVTISPERIEKTGKHGSTSLSLLSSQAVYLETKDMVVLLGATDGLALVLPARCLTAEAADVLHGTVLKHMPPERCRIRDMVVPQAEKPLTSPVQDAEAAEEAGESLNMTVQYTPEEFFAMLRDGAYRGFVTRLPYILLLALVSALLWGSLYGLRGGVMVFVLLAVALFLLNTVGATYSARRRVKAMTPGDLTIRLRFNHLGITGDQGLFVAWNAIRHAVDRPDCLEFYNSRLFIRVPKRCVENLDALCRLADRYMQVEN